MPTAGHVADIYAPGFDFGSFLKTIKASGSQDVADATSFNSGGVKEYITGLKDGTLSASGMWMSTAASTTDIDIVMANLLQTTDKPWTYYPRGDAFGYPCKMLTGTVTKWDIESPIEDITKAELEVQSTVSGGGIENLLVHRALATAGVSGGTGGTAIDNGASTATGGVGFVINTTYTSGANAVKIQHSVDNSVWVDLITFTSIGAANVAERIELAAGTTVNRYTRCFDTITTTAKTYGCSFGRGQ